MKKKEEKIVRECIEMEGFDYCFIDYTDFSDIKDEEFHRLRLAYVKANIDLKKYLHIEGF